MRIVVSGPTGTGKTTLVKALAERLGLPVLAEEMNDLFRLEGLYKKARRDGRDKALLDQAASAWGSAFIDWAKRRSTQYDGHRGFVADRWEADLLDIWLVKFAGRDVDKATAWLLNDMRRKARTLDLAVVLPLQDIMGSMRNEAALPRVGFLSGRILNSLLTRALIGQCPGLKTLQLPARPLSVDERVTLVERAFAQRSST